MTITVTPLVWEPWSNGVAYATTILGMYHTWETVVKSLRDKGAALALQYMGLAAELEAAILERDSLASKVPFRSVNRPSKRPLVDQAAEYQNDYRKGTGC